MPKYFHCTPSGMAILRSGYMRGSNKLISKGDATAKDFKKQPHMLEVFFGTVGQDDIAKGRSSAREPNEGDCRAVLVFGDQGNLIQTGSGFPRVTGFQTPLAALGLGLVVVAREDIKDHKGTDEDLATHIYFHNIHTSVNAKVMVLVKGWDEVDNTNLEAWIEQAETAGAFPVTIPVNQSSKGKCTLI